MALELQFLPARQGDAIWVRWGDGHQMFVDMGTEETGVNIRRRLLNLPEEQRSLDLLVVTHVDRDHIGGVLTCIAEPDEVIDGLEVGDVWFNGWEHIGGSRVETVAERLENRIEPMGPAQGERLSTWLRGQRWNEEFDRGPVVRSEGSDNSRLLADGLKVSVLGPTQKRLSRFRSEWKREVDRALARRQLENVPLESRPSSEGTLESLGSSARPNIRRKSDLEGLAKQPETVDKSLSNATSICLLLEWHGRRILLTGDARADDITEGINSLCDEIPVAMDLVKLPHHGSRNNVSRAFVQSVDCPYWVFSTDGSGTPKHPDAGTVAKVLHWGRHPSPTLGFNVPSQTNGWWSDSEWRAMLRYDVQYGTVENGLTVAFSD